MASSNTLPEGTDSIIEGAGVLGEDEDQGGTTGSISEDMLTGAVAGNAGKGASDATPGSYGTSGIGGTGADTSGGGTGGSGLAKDRPYERDTSATDMRGSSGRAGGSDGDEQESANEGTPASLRQQANDKVLELRGQATDRARDYAEQGKARATEALDNVVRMISDTAAQVDDKVGTEYGDYARRAGSMVEQLADTLRDKDVDALFADARELVRRSPGLAASAAAVVGFALVRVIKAGLDAPVQGGRPASPKAG